LRPKSTCYAWEAIFFGKCNLSAIIYKLITFLMQGNSRVFNELEGVLFFQLGGVVVITCASQAEPEVPYSSPA
jgi:hypothetical protein